jgi:membrane fusion protein, copper/silver efflux system
MSPAKQIILSVGLVAVAVTAVTYQLRSGDAGPAEAEAGGHDMASMSAGGGELMPVVLDADAARRIGVTLATVEHRELPVFLRTVGTVAYDETSLATVSPKIDGWVERLHIDFTGAPVRAGEPLMDVYSPALVTAQEELVLALRLIRDAQSDRSRRNGEELLAAARRRLAYWDVPEDEIRRIEESGEPQRTLTFNSPASGIVVEKNVVTGDRIMPGMTVYRIADLSRVWLEAEVFEKDLALISLGQGAEVSFEAYPGRRYQARVTYVHPTVSVQSRTARLRLELPNPSQALKPGMYAQIELEAPALPATLVVPRSAVIATGERALVFVEGPDGALLPREVQPGRTVGRFMEILEGLAMGDRIVSSAAFLVDAESNLGTMTGDPGEGPDEEVDHSQMDMSGSDSTPDTTMDMGNSEPEVDHSQMDMGAADTMPDTTSGSGGAGHEEHQGQGS